MISIAIVGPESTGKSTLSSALAEHFKTVSVPEYSRDFLSNLDKAYRQEDLLDIAKGQVMAAEEGKKEANQLLFLDTDLFVIKVWSEFKYGNCDPLILQMLAANKADYYLLTSPDIPYEDDPLRENPGDREELFEIYHKELVAAGVSFKIVTGYPQKRIQEAIQVINELLIKE